MLLPSKTNKINGVKKIVRELPAFNRLNLRYLIVFLSCVASDEYRNKMNPKGLGICIGSNLLRLPKVWLRVSVQITCNNRFTGVTWINFMNQKSGVTRVNFMNFMNVGLMNRELDAFVFFFASQKRGMQGELAPEVTSHPTSLRSKIRFQNSFIDPTLHPKREMVLAIVWVKSLISAPEMRESNSLSKMPTNCFQIIRWIQLLCPYRRGVFTLTPQCVPRKKGEVSLII